MKANFISHSPGTFIVYYGTGVYRMTRSWRGVKIDQQKIRKSRLPFLRDNVSWERVWIYNHSVDVDFKHKAEVLDVYSNIFQIYIEYKEEWEDKTPVTVEYQK